MSLTARVLVVEDDLAMQALIIDFLQLQGCRVDCTRLAVEAVNRVTTGGYRYDLIISDINMPQMNGLELLRALRTGADKTPILLITAFGNELLKKQSVNEGAAGYLDKPFKLSDLKEEVCRILGYTPGATKARS